MDGSCSARLFTQIPVSARAFVCERMARLPLRACRVQYFDRLPVRPDGLENAVFCELSEEDRVLSCLDLRGADAATAFPLSSG